MYATDNLARCLDCTTMVSSQQNCSTMLTSYWTTDITGFLSHNNSCLVSCMASSRANRKPLTGTVSVVQSWDSNIPTSVARAQHNWPTHWTGILRKKSTKLLSNTVTKYWVCRDVSVFFFFGWFVIVNVAHERGCGSLLPARFCPIRSTADRDVFPEAGDTSQSSWPPLFFSR